MILDEAHEAEADEENYFVSMTDMMVGLVFIFIIMLMYFALQFQTQTERWNGANEERSKILVKIQQSLLQKGVAVKIDEQNGILRLPDAILFDSGKAELKPQGQFAVDRLAEVLAEILPCYADGPNLGLPQSSHCVKTPYRIESVYVEGHTDDVPLAGAGTLRDNLDLSAFRATNTFRELTRFRQEISALCSNSEGSCRAVLSVSGYGSNRPVDNGVSEDAKRKNRRIDLRLTMVAPDWRKPAIEAVSREISRK